MQVHISLVGKDKMRISWITEEDPNASTAVIYGTSSGLSDGISATGTTSSYKYTLYKSGNIHDVIIGPLKPNTTYYYRCGPSSTQEFSFKTPPPQFPINFAVAGTTVLIKKIMNKKKSLQFCILRMHNSIL